MLSWWWSEGLALSKIWHFLCFCYGIIFCKMVVLNHIWFHTLERNLLNVVSVHGWNCINAPTVRKHFHRRGILTSICWHILCKNHIHASIVRKHFHRRGILTNIWWLIQWRNHINAPNVRKHFHRRGILTNIWWLILGRNHTNAASVRKHFLWGLILKHIW